ncbi:MAG: hypothetical protein B6229_04275 [Spirochaetaceae bacterium 4572_7]|nr:MAG: hypothetical protein B6229_04275 [Spirochaetaceae bacterium 4572_7]
MLEELKCSVRKHSKKQLEIKVTYPLNETDKTNRFNLDLYYFFPAQLRVNNKRIGRTGFLNSMRINTRFSSPKMSLEKVLDVDFDLSPLSRIEKLVDQNLGTDLNSHNKMIYELQTLSNLYRTEIVSFVKLIKREIKKCQRKDIYQDSIITKMELITIFLKRFRILHTIFLNNNLNEDLRVALNWADESLSIITEKWLIKLFDYSDDLTELNIENIKNVINNEVLYRKSMKFRYHPRRIGHVTAGIAAGVAMAVTVLITIYIVNYFPQNSHPFIIAIIFAYILKDRIKDILKGVLGNMFPNLTTDQQLKLFDPALKNNVGRSSGTVKFTSNSAIPENVYKIRYKKSNLFRRILPANSIAHYRRSIRLNSGVLRENHARLNSITEIIRFQISDWLQEMDDPTGDLWFLKNGKKIKINGNRVYKVHLIIVLDGKKNYHYNLVLNRSGLVRITKDEV